MSNTIINFDSLNGCVYNTGNTYNTYAFNSAYLNLAPNSFNANFTLQTPLRNIKRISLKSIEMPIGFNNIRSSSKTNIIGVSVSYDGTTYRTIYSITLSDKTYSSITTLLNDINTAFATLYPSVNIYFVVNTSGYVTVASATTAIFTGNMYVVGTTLAYILGFRTGLNTLATRLTTAATVYNLNIDNYLNMYITNISAQASNNANGVLNHFKIILNSTNGVVYYVAESNSYKQSIEVNPHIPISSLNILMTDRFGFSVNSSSLDYSFTLSFET